MKICCILLVLLFVEAALADSPRPLTVKERVRLSLWYNGLHHKKVKKHKLVQQDPKLPEELARPLSKI
jgi:hypothetical protein